MLSAVARSRLLASPPVIARNVRWASKIPSKGQPAADNNAAAAETRGDPESAASSSSPLDQNVASGSTATGAAPSLDFMPSAPEEEPKRTGAVSSKGTLSSGEKKRKVMSRVMMALLGGAFAAHTVYLGREWEEEELKDKRLVSLILLRARKPRFLTFCPEVGRCTCDAVGENKGTVWRPFRRKLMIFLRGVNAILMRGVIVLQQTRLA